MPVAIPSQLGQQPSVKDVSTAAKKTREIPDVAMEPLRYPGDEAGASEKKEHVERVGREKSVRSWSFISFSKTELIIGLSTADLDGKA